MTAKHTRVGASQSKTNSGAKGDRKDLHVRREKSRRAVDSVISKTIKKYGEALRKLEKY